MFNFICKIHLIVQLADTPSSWSAARNVPYLLPLLALILQKLDHDFGAPLPGVRNWKYYYVKAFHFLSTFFFHCSLIIFFQLLVICFQSTLNVMYGRKGKNAYIRLYGFTGILNGFRQNNDLAAMNTNIAILA